MTYKQSRRSFIQQSAALSALAGMSSQVSAFAKTADDWWQGDIVHLLPMVNDNRILLKTSFSKPLTDAPVLYIDGKPVSGLMSGTTGRFWRFDAAGLDAGRQFELQIKDSAGKPLCDPWPLKTFPSPDDPVSSMRVMIYTCAGGDENKGVAQGLPEAVPKALRQRFFKRGLSMQPDAVIAVGDQVYLDLETGINDKIYGPGTIDFFDEYGWLDETLPILGSTNEPKLAAMVDQQIALLYGVMFRSVPTYLTMDDHDYFENDEASAKRITFPIKNFNLQLGRSTQHLYFPEFLPDRHRPLGLSGSSAGDRGQGLSEAFGTIRYGKLAELLMYDCRRFMDLKAEFARFVPSDAEAWLLDRTRHADTDHCIHIPSTPMGWSAGKWGEWYPDILNGHDLTVERKKPHWQQGWFSQHQRILSALHAQERRPGVMVSGDLHAIGYGVINRSRNLKFDDNPIHSILSGPLGTEQEGFPSFYRGIGAQVAVDLDVTEITKPLEKLGFTMLDISKGSIKVEQYAWWRPDAEMAVDDLKPFAKYEIAR